MVTCYLGFCGCCGLVRVMSNSCDSMDSSPLCSSVHGTSQARILKQVAISFSSHLQYLIILSIDQNSSSPLSLGWYLITLACPQQESCQVSLVRIPYPWCLGQEATEPYTEQLTGSKLGKEYNKAVHCHPVYLTYVEYIMRNAGLDESSWN